MDIFYVIQWLKIIRVASSTNRISALLIENTFYQYIDKNGLLHESLFLPFGVLGLVFGVILILFQSLSRLFRLITRR
jgi:hypothetical protein